MSSGTIVRVLTAAVLLTAAGAVSGEPPEYAMGGARRTLVERALSLKAGTLRADVVAKLGQPSSVRELTERENRGGGHALRYDVVTWIKTQPSPDDQYVEVYLNKDDRLSYVTFRAAVEGRK
jgi:hypothetical protein